MGFFDKIKQGLTRTKENIGSSLETLFVGEVTEDFYDELEETLILADFGGELSMTLVEELRDRVKSGRIRSAEEAKEQLRELLCEELEVGDPALQLDTSPSVIMVIGVNGVGKTTTIGKLSSALKSEGKSVLVAAADTFRAAAADQLEIWSQRSGVPIIRQGEGADPAAVLFDATSAAKARKADVVMVDTAGRLHNKQNLMKELEKMSRVLDRELPNASRETLLVLDATTGQNGLIQAKQFMDIAPITGIVLTKLDGSAKGGIVVAIARTLQIPVKYIGVGEGIDDLMPFEARAFVEAFLPETVGGEEP